MKHINSIKRNAIALVAILLTGCAVGPDFIKPEPPKTDRFTSEVLNLETTPSDESSQQIILGKRIDEAWWELFQSDSINLIVKQALENSPSIASAVFTLEQAQETAAAKAGGLYPQLGISGGIGRQKYGEAFLGPIPAPPPFTYFAIGPVISYTLDYTGGLSRSVEQQTAFVEFQKQQLNAAYLAVSGNAVIFSIKIASLEKQIAITQELVGLDKKNLTLINEAFQAGAVSRIAISNAEGQLAIDMALLPPILQELNIAQHALATLLGQTPANSKLPELNLDKIALPKKISVDIPSEIAHRRPDILASEAQLHAATAAVGVATSNLYPQINLNASFSQQAMTANQVFSPGMNAWSLTSGIFAPIFEGGTLLAQQRAAVAVMRANAAKYQQTVLTAFAQIADCLQALEHDAASVQAQTMAYTAASDNNRFMQISNREGSLGILKLIDSQRQMQLADLALTKSNSQRYIDTTQLFLALGGSEI